MDAKSTRNETSNESNLAAKARDGDQNALTELVAITRARLLALASAELSNSEDAQDAVCSALLSICLHVDRLRQPDRISPWMNSIVRNETRRLRRDPHALLLRFDELTFAAAEPSIMHRVCLNADIEQALRQLPPEQASAIRLFYFARLSITEIALQMCCPEGTVKSWLHFGRQHLATSLAAYNVTRPSAKPPHMGVSIDRLLHRYALQFDADPITADRRLLTRAHELVHTKLRNMPLSCELVHTAVDMHWNWTEDAFLVSGLLTRYLQQPLSVTEEAWARFEYADSLAALGNSVGVVEQQTSSLSWARAEWKAGRLTSQQLLRVMSDSTQAQYWIDLGLLDEWLAIFEELMCSVLPAPGNRMERFYLLRTACHMNRDKGRYTAALSIAEQISALADEDTAWDRAYEMLVQGEDARMRVYAAQGNGQAVRDTGERVAALLEARWQEIMQIDIGDMGGEAQTRLMIQIENIGSTLFHARQYDLSIPLHRRCLELGYSREFVYMWLAAALWTESGDRNETLELLRQGAARTRSPRSYREDFTSLPEFVGVWEAEDFLNAITYSSSTEPSKQP